MTDYLYTVEALGISGVTNQPHLVWNGSEAVLSTETDACYTNSTHARKNRRTVCFIFNSSFPFSTSLRFRSFTRNQRRRP